MTNPELEKLKRSEFARIELVWPGKDMPSSVRQDPDGRWHIDRQSAARRLHPLTDLRRRGDRDAGSLSLVVAGDRLAALNTLRRGCPRKVTFAYLDAPRIEIDDQAAAFRGDPIYAYSTWLTVLRAHIGFLLSLMSRAGVVAVLTGDLEEPYARLLLADELGRDNYIGTVVWQRSYAPRGMRGMKEFTATHDCIVLFAIDKSALPAVGLRLDAAEAGFANPDNDPRGPWRAAHKGARTRRAKSDFNTYVPPYRWRLVDGRLPEGLWRLNPLTGVIWGTPSEPGEFPLAIEVRDSSGATATAQMLLRIAEAGTPSELPDVPWVFEAIATRGGLRILTNELPVGVLDQEYSAVLLAEGGDPYTAPPKRPGSGRYWEFADDTLRAAYARDKVDLGADGNVIPRIKDYVEPGQEVVQNQQTWWPAKDKNGASFTGFTQDATKHLKKLREVGLITENTTTSKPEHLLARLLSIFTRPGDLALEMFGSTADLAAVAIKLKRDFIYLAGDSERDLRLLEECALGRLQAVVDGKDNDLHLYEGEIRMGPDAYLPYEGGGGFTTCRVGDWLFEQDDREDFPHMNRSFADPKDLAAAVLTTQGFLLGADDPFAGTGFDGSSAVVVPPEEFMTPELASRLVSASDGRRLTVFYFMATDDFDASLGPASVGYRRVPAEVAMF